MAGSPKLKVTKYFGGASVQKIEMDVEDAKSNLGYFWTPDGGSNIIVSIEGQPIKYKNMAFIEVGLFLSNDGHKSIWDKK
jgi:hypothetical protein